MWSFETARFVVVLYAEPEDMDPADSFEFADDIAFARTGDFAHWFCAVVEIEDKATGEILGRDTLGGCSYNSLAEFWQYHFAAPAECRNTLARKAKGIYTCDYFPSLVREAISEARGALRRASLLAGAIDHGGEA